MIPFSYFITLKTITRTQTTSKVTNKLRSSDPQASDTIKTSRFEISALDKTKRWTYTAETTATISYNTYQNMKLYIKKKDK